MIFTSFEFAIFLPLSFLIYWSLPSSGKARNYFLLFASYFFYGFWDWRFLGLIILSTLIDFSIGSKMLKSSRNKQKRLLITSLVSNLSLLFFFKYFNFFMESFADTFTFLGMPFSLDRLNIILPVGISFYTFQTLSYTIDVYRKKLKPTDDFVEFAAFVTFFPQLVAGPIERATNLLPQFFQKKKFDYYENGIKGLRQILWGTFKKIVIADSCAEIVNEIFASYSDQSGYILFFGAILFSFQIYGDFSGYSDIAIGTARLFGFDLMQNFNFPYFSRDIAEFWRRWHISLSTWFRDYLYIPLGGSKGGKLSQIKNTFIIFLVSGFWHGANWTFVIWGALNAILFLPLMLLNRNRKNLGDNPKRKFAPPPKELLSIIFTFFMVTICWIFFRAENLPEAIHIVLQIFEDFANKDALISLINALYWDYGFVVPILLLFFIFIEWIGRSGKFAVDTLFLKSNGLIRKSFYAAIVILIAFYMQTEESPFIYFDF